MARRMLLFLGLAIALVLPATQVAVASPSATLPPTCTLAPGRFEVLPPAATLDDTSEVAFASGGTTHRVRVVGPSLSCKPPVSGVFAHYRLMRYWVTSNVWTVEHEAVFAAKSETQAQGPTYFSPRQNINWYCVTPGALMGLQVEERIYSGATRVADVTYSGRTTAVCPGGSPQPPLGCVVNAGQNGVSPSSGAHHAVLLTARGVTCPIVSTQASNIASYVELMRYWVTSKVWTVERSLLVTSAATNTTPAELPDKVVAFYCNTPGALMSMRVVDHFYVGTVLAVPLGAPTSFADVTYPGTSTAICPA